MQEIHEQYYDSREEFTSEDKFWIAAGIISYGDSDKQQIEDPEIGVLKFYHKSWGVHDDDDKISFKELNTEMCRKEDFNNIHGTNSDSKFFKTRPQSEQDIKVYGH